MYTASLAMLLAMLPIEVDLQPCADPSEVTVDTVSVEGVQYHVLSVDGYGGWGDGLWMPGEPLLPAVSRTYLLPPDTEVDHLEIFGETWVPLPGSYLLMPRQRGLTDDSVFIPPDQGIYGEDSVFPASPVSVSRQGSAMGFSVATLTASPVRYRPSDGCVEVLTSVDVSIHPSVCSRERLHPLRENRWSGEMRERGILALVCNPGDTVLYSSPQPVSFAGRSRPLEITAGPSSTGDCVDLLIITDSSLEESFTELASIRNREGIATAVRTVQWIQENYSGCDTPERIRNFIRDAHQYWGTQAVLLGGDDGVVPVRQCNGWAYVTYPFPTFQMPSDDYYGDIDGDWVSGDGLWSTGYQNGYLDLCVGRWPVNDPVDVNTMLAKTLLYERPEDPPEGFGRSILMMGSNDVCGTAADDMMELRALFESSGAVPLYLDEPEELYYPHSLPAGDLCRANALEAFDRGFNLILHADHSETHKLATAGKNSLGQYMWDSDFATMSNASVPSILWTLGCGPGHFDGADCFAEAGMLTSPGTGLAAVIANARYGLFSQKVTYFVFADALFNTGYTSGLHGIETAHWPVSYLGEAHRISKNVDGISFVLLNLLGSPLMRVWRDTPTQLEVTLPPMVMVEGAPSDLLVTVTDGSDPVPGATVCLYKESEVFCVQYTGPGGTTLFEDVTVFDCSDGDLWVTASKPRSVSGVGGSTVCNYVPVSVQVDVLPSSAPVLSLSGYTIPDGGDGRANPGETVEIYPAVLNSGGREAAGVSATVEIVSGGQYVKALHDWSCLFPDVEADSSVESLDPLVVEIEKGVPEYSDIGFRLVLSTMEGGGPRRWVSDLKLTVCSDQYQVTCMDPLAENSTGGRAVVRISDILLVNSGLGEGRDIRLTVGNLSPPEPFRADTLFIPQLEPGGVIDLEEELRLTVLPVEPRSSWLRQGFPRCTFDIVALSKAGSSVVRTVEVDLVSGMQSDTIQPPVGAGIYETGQETVSLVWDHQGCPEATAYYLYLVDGGSVSRVFPLPLPVNQATVEGLEPGREYLVLVTAIDEIGRESEPAEVTANTSRPAVPGWPLQLSGSPGGGPAVADIDMDGYPELVVATSFGSVYLIERDASFTVLEPPPGYDFDRSLGCAVGNVDGTPGNEIVVTCQKSIEVEGQERVGVLLYRRLEGCWSCDEIAQTGVNQQAASPVVAGTPVLFQADGGESLEIALRTRGHFGTDAQLCVWRMTPDGQWTDFGPEFPLDLFSCFYNSPTAVDFDCDGLEELIVTSIGTGAGTALTVVDFEHDEPAVIARRNLYELDTGGEYARVFGTIASAEQDGEFYLAGIASTVDPCGTEKKAFVYQLDGGPGRMTLAWSTDWLPGSDFWGNIPGPALGDPDGDSDLDLLYMLNDGLFLKEGLLYAWDLATGETSFVSDTIQFNPILEEGGHYVRSQPVSGLLSASGAPGMPVFSCYSSLLCGFSPSTGSSMIDGFPAWSRDAGWSAPALCDLDGNGVPEVLHVDYSGLATLYSLDEFLYDDRGWHMYQDNALRSGFYNSIPFDPGLELHLGSVRRAEDTSTFGDGCPLMIAEVEITGSGGIRSAGEERVSRPVEVRVLESDGTPCGSAFLDLRDGLFTVAIPLDRGIPFDEPLTVVLDPDDRYGELDESGNRTVAGQAVTVPAEGACSVRSVSGCIFLSLELPSRVPGGLEALVYSMDGRLTAALETGGLEAGHSIIPLDTGHLPSGIYGVLVRGMPSGDRRFTVPLLTR
ncbi:MAG: hypothetical protein AVO35_02380 [Candidatus Aegiribacteria sp. MLS_C]|nr:MAG: hypothetical protein AVO35_02380 [Candidatus Aegiribacteria sp. MLS_C]